MLRIAIVVCIALAALVPAAAASAQIDAPNVEVSCPIGTTHACRPIMAGTSSTASGCVVTTSGDVSCSSK